MATTIIGLSGSLRRESFNTRLLQAAAGLCPEGAALDVRTVEGIPLYNADLEAADGIPDPVTVLKDAIAEADGLLIATPEYNNSMSGVLKNAMDWLSRPPGDIARVFRDRPLSIIGATPGGFGTVLAQNAWLPVVRTLGTRFWTGGRLLVPGAAKLFDDNGTLVDEAMEKRLAAFMSDFVAFIEHATD